MSWANIEEHARYSERVNPKSRRKCRCGCGRRATHNGMTNGISLYTGCELSVARWVRDPRDNARDRLAARSMGK